MKTAQAWSSQLTIYWPLMALLFIAAMAASALTYRLQAHALEWMHDFMGFLFCQFALLKLIDPRGFADGFQKYDLLAKHSRGYALAYPWIELGLGLAYLGAIWPFATNLITGLLMLLGTIGVLKSLKEGLDVRCACMGSALKVPLSTVTLAEDIGMGIMAFGMLFKL